MLDSLLDNVLGEKPVAFDWQQAMRQKPDPEERRKLSAHADACHFRQIENKWMFSQIRIAQYRDRKLLLTIALLGLPNVLGVNVRDIVSFLLP